MEYEVVKPEGKGRAILFSEYPRDLEVGYISKEGEELGRIVVGDDERPLVVIGDKAYRAFDPIKELKRRYEAHRLQKEGVPGSYLTELYAFFHYSIHHERPRFVPEGYEAAVIVTADVDFMRKTPHRRYFRDFKRLLKRPVRALRYALRTILPLDLKPTLKRLAYELDGRLTFFRLPKDGTIYSSDYTLEEVPKTKAEHELHLPAEVSMFGKPLKYRFLGSRSHYLVLNEHVIRELSRLNYSYDATVGFPDVGLPKGFVHPFEIHLSGKPTGVLEIGHTYSDLSFFRGYDFYEAYDIAKRFHGFVTINRHPRYAYDEMPEYYETLYKFLDSVEKEARITNAIDYVSRVRSNLYHTSATIGFPRYFKASLMTAGEAVVNSPKRHLFPSFLASSRAFSKSLFPIPRP